MIPLIPIAAIVGIGAAMFSGDASANTPPVNYEPADSGGDIPYPVDPTETGKPPVQYEEPTSDDPTLNMNKNLDAFMAVISKGESNDDFGALVGGGSFNDFTHHPGWTDSSMRTISAWKGWTPPGARPSHAAGAFQIQPRTFKECSDALNLQGAFGKAEQTAAAIYLIRRRGAYDDIGMGRISVAVGKLRNEWAFFSSPRWTLNTVIAHYEEEGGNTA